MAKIIHIYAPIRTSMAQQVADALNSGSGPATLQFYTAPMPANAGVAVSTQTLLGTLICSDPVGSIDSGDLTFGAITMDSAADADGVAVWARLKPSNGNYAVDLNVGALGSDSAIELNNVNILAGGPILMSDLVISMGG